MYNHVEKLDCEFDYFDQGSGVKDWEKTRKRKLLAMRKGSLLTWNSSRDCPACYLPFYCC